MYNFCTIFKRFFECNNVIKFFSYFTVLKTPDVKSISLEDVAKLLAQAEKEGRQVMVLPPPEKPLQNLIGGPDGLNPGPGKRLVAKSIPTQNQVSTLHDHDHNPNEFEQQPNG